MQPVSNSSVFERVLGNNPEEEYAEEEMLLRDSEQNTPLSCCLRQEKKQSLSALLQANALSSVFVKGYSPGSLLCTLPMAVQPPSSVFKHPPPIEISSETTAQLDEQLAKYVVNLHNEKLTKRLEADRKEHILKSLCPDENSKEHRLCRILMNFPQFEATGRALVHRYDKLHGEKISLSDLKDVLLTTSAVVLAENEKNEKVFRFTFLCVNESCTFVPTGEAVTVAAAVETECSEYLIKFDNNVVKQVSIENLKPLKKIEKIERDVVQKASFTHPGCAAERPPNPSVSNVQSCTACGGVYVKCSGSYGSRNSSGHWTQGVCKNQGDTPESPNDDFCTALCEQHGPSSPAAARVKVVNAHFRIGDKVMLKNYSSVSGKHSLCLGSPGDKNIGVIVKLEKCQAKDKSTGSYSGGFSSQRNRGRTRTKKDSTAQVTASVMALHSGLIDSYSDNQLRFADGSTLEPPSEVESGVGTGIPDGNSVKIVSGSSRDRKFKGGDCVKLKKEAADIGGCLGHPKLKWEGVVASAGRNITVKCHENAVLKNPNYKFPNHTYNASDLLLVNEFQKGDIEPLRVGDRVQLLDEFKENYGDGWCLGHADKPKTGIVVFSPITSSSDSDSLSKEQRHVGVIAESDNDSSHVYWFRGSWLKRTRTDVFFNVGDRVQLDPTRMLHVPDNYSRKCLGHASDAAYGLVVNAGVKQKDGSSRNIEVVAITGSKSMRVSFYSSYDLNSAHRAVVMNEADKTFLEESVAQCMKSCKVDRESIDVDDFINTNGINSWGRLFEITDFSPLVREAWIAWKSGNELEWPDADMQLNLQTMSYTTGLRSIFPTAKWTCSKLSGGKCRGKINSPAMLKCSICGCRPHGWKCNYCSTSNPAWSPICATCSVSPADSAELLEVQEREAQILEDEKEKERLRLQQIEAEMLALKSSEADAIPEGRFIHPGSLNMCGGNPSGFAKCNGGGECSSGPNSCERCGAGTHWTCCFSEDVDSVYCTEGITLDQATSHAKILADSSEVLRRVSDIPGLVITGAALDWSCPACTSFNDIMNTTCEICDTKAPIHVVHKQKEASASKNNDKKTDDDRKQDLSSIQSKAVMKRAFQATFSNSIQKLAAAMEMEKNCPISQDELRERLSSTSSEESDLQFGTGTWDDSDSDSDDSVFGNQFHDDFDYDSDQWMGKDMLNNDDSCDMSSRCDDQQVDKLTINPRYIPDDMELNLNAVLSETYFHTSVPILSSDSDVEKDLSNVPPVMNRHTSTAFFSLSSFEKLCDIDELTHFTDKNGNTASHHAAYMGLNKTFDALIKYGASQWSENCFGDSPNILRAGFKLESGNMLSKFHKVLAKRNFLTGRLLDMAMRTPFDYMPDPSAEQVLQAILSAEDEYDAAYLVDEAILENVPHAKLYRALFSLQFQYGPMKAKKELKEYESELLSDGKMEFVDPLYFITRFRLWTSNNGKMSSYAKGDRLEAHDALCAFRFFAPLAEKWLDPEENFDEEVRQSGIDTDDPLPDVLDDDYSDLFPPLGPDDPETLWEKAKAEYGMVSPSMDALMQLTGLKAVKHKAKDVCLSVLLDPPKDLQTGTSCNFTFIGNPGTGKTTVAELLSKAMSELKYRTNDTPVFTSADEILGANQPVAAFSQMVQDADGGTLFIDEAYLFDPAPKGRTQNESNKVLNVLLKVAEKMRLTTTFILAGYKEEIQTLLGCNPGFPSRFPKTFTFDFADYNEAELTIILNEMTRRRKYRFESQKECGVPIARILAREIHMGAHTKGFGNGRECEKVLDLCIQNQMSRLVRWKENKIPISENDYRTLTRKDTVGERPKLEDSVHMAELDAMVGLVAVKTKLRNLMNLQLQNYDAKMRGEKIQRISLHRVFYGNPGTGKTTVAKLLGKMLKEFRYLTDGDIITCTPADLKGSAVGEGVARTKALLDSAKGKVLFIDEAYNLDPARGSGTFGAEVLDVILEKIEANAGSDMCVILAGYKPQMEQLFRNVQNPGLKRRFNLGEAFLFEDFSDEEIRLVLKRQIVQSELYASSATLDHAVTLISQKRLEEGFGNAGEAEQMLTRAKLRHSARLSEGGVKDSSDMKLLIAEDFDGEITSLEKAREAFADLQNIDHVTSVLNSYEAMCSVADDEDIPRHELLADCHMLFLGPPGSGKTTMGKRFAMMFKQLNLLPSDRFEYTTAGNLIDRFVGGTSNNTVEAMRRAKGGVLMIDEAYAMLPHRNHFGGDVMQALLDNVTTEEYKGKIIIILSGYKDDVEELFGLNPGFQSRFDKKRVEFPEWTGEMASGAVQNIIEREGKIMNRDAVEAMTGYFEGLRNLPNWASARDAMEWIKPSLDAARAERQFQSNQEKRSLQDALDGHAGARPKRKASAKSKTARASMDPPLPYTLDDVRKVFTNAIFARGGQIDEATGSVISNSADGPVRSLTSMVAFKEVQSTAARQKKLVVICFTSPSTCQPCQNFEPLFNDIAADNSDVTFAKVYAEKGQAIFRKMEVRSVPHTMLFFDGAKTDEVMGCDPSKLKHVIMSHRARQKKYQNNAPLPQPPTPSNMLAPPSAKVTQPSQSSLPQNVMEKEKDKVKVKVLKPDNDVSDDDDDDEPSDNEAWAALEDACAELGYSLEQLRDMLNDASTFPPKELMDLVLKKVKSKNPANVKNMLQKQRPGVLVKINTAIEEDKKKKTEEEEQMQENVQAIGKCPMGFTWHKEGAGWRCGGGSHFVSDYDIENYMYTQDMYG